MKKATSIISIFLFCANAINAQSLHVGVKAGANLQKIEAVPFKDKFTFGYQAGVYAIVGLTSKVRVQPEVLFSTVNADTATQFSTVYGFKQTDKIKINYIDIPILLNIKFLPFLTLQAGPQFSVLLDKNESLLKNGQRAFKEGNIAAALGLQLKFSKINIYSRYVAGLNNINDVGTNDKWKSRNIQIGIGYNIF